MIKGNKIRRTKELEGHLDVLADLYLQKVPQTKIAKQLGISPATVTRDMKILVARWKDSSLSNINDKIHIELRTIDRVEAEAWTAWEKSKLDKTKRTDKVNAVHAKIRKDIADREGVVPGTEKLIETIKSTEGRVGDPRYLEVVARCIERRCKIMGLDSPERHEITGKDGAPIFEIVLTDSITK